MEGTAGVTQPFFSAGVTPRIYVGPPQFPGGEMPPVTLTEPQVTSPILRDRRVVIVEDEGFTLIHLRKICGLVGMQVVATGLNGEQGVQRVLETHPDIVLMDIKMPVLDGLSAAERILKELSVCVVMLSAYDLEDFQGRAREIGACGYVLKPVSASTLIPQLEAAYVQFGQRPE